MLVSIVSHHPLSNLVDRRGDSGSLVASLGQNDHIAADLVAGGISDCTAGRHYGVGILCPHHLFMAMAAGVGVDSDGFVLFWRQGNV